MQQLAAAFYRIALFAVEQFAPIAGVADKGPSAPPPPTPPAAAPAPVPVKKLPATGANLLQMREALSAVLNQAEGGDTKAIAILAKYGVAKASDLKPEFYDAVVRECNEALEATAKGPAQPSVLL